MYDTSSSPGIVPESIGARALRASRRFPLSWHIEGTGGNCSAFVARGERAEYYIVAAEGFRPPFPGERCTLGVWDGCGESVSNHPCRLAAVAAAERFEHESERIDALAADALRLDGAE